MLLVDILLVVILLAFAGAGYNDGFVMGFGRLLGHIIAFGLSRAFSIHLVPLVGIFFPPSWSRAIAFILMFIVITRLIAYLFKLVNGLWSIVSMIPFLKPINGFLGGILGFAEGIIVLGALNYVVLTFNLEPHLVTWLTHSVVAGWIRYAFTFSIGFLL